MIGQVLGSYQVLAKLAKAEWARCSRTGHEAEPRRRHEGAAAAFADDPERLARFTREAQTLASLNHPNIATIHGLGSSTSPPPLAPAEWARCSARWSRAPSRRCSSRRLRGSRSNGYRCLRREAGARPEGRSMSLASGSRLGAYEIQAPIGAGGMARSIARPTAT